MAFQRPTAGQLRDRVELQKRATAASGADSASDSYTVVATVWARVRALFGARFIDGRQTEERVTHNICIRYRSDFGNGAGQWNHIEIGPAGDRRRYKVQTVMDPDNRREWLEILAEEMERNV